MREITMLAAALFASSVAIAQTSAEPAAPTAPSKFTKCLTGGEMNSLFQSGRAEQLPNYTAVSYTHLTLPTKA